MQKILLHCKSLDEARALKSFLETRLPYEVVLSFNMNETESTISNRAVHLVIYETEAFNASDLKFIKETRSLGYLYPILVITDTLGFEQFHVTSEKFKTHFLERPFEYKALKGITRKLMVSRNIPQQMHRRFRTNQSTMLETFVSGEKHSTQMFNLSMGGAYFEFPKKPQLAIGDLIRMRVQLDDMKREYNVNARVVWTTHKGHAAGGHGVGVRFVKHNDIYRQLMEKV